MFWIYNIFVEIFRLYYRTVVYPLFENSAVFLFSCLKRIIFQHIHRGHYCRLFAVHDVTHSRCDISARESIARKPEISCVSSQEQINPFNSEGIPQMLYSG